MAKVSTLIYRSGALSKILVTTLDSDTVKSHKEDFLGLAEELASIFPSLGSNLTRAIERVVNKEPNEYFSSYPPIPIIPQGEIHSILNISPIEMARQWTLIERNLFSKIQTYEFNIIFTKINPEERSPNLLHFKRFSDSVSEKTKPQK
jgi:hypothetical protein